MTVEMLGVTKINDHENVTSNTLRKNSVLFVIRIYSICIFYIILLNLNLGYKKRDD